MYYCGICDSDKCFCLSICLLALSIWQARWAFTAYVPASVVAGRYHSGAVARIQCIQKTLYPNPNLSHKTHRINIIYMKRITTDKIVIKTRLRRLSLIYMIDKVVVYVIPMWRRHHYDICWRRQIQGPKRWSGSTRGSTITNAQAAKGSVYFMKITIQQIWINLLGLLSLR